MQRMLDICGKHTNIHMNYCIIEQYLRLINYTKIQPTKNNNNKLMMNKNYVTLKLLSKNFELFIFLSNLAV